MPENPAIDISSMEDSSTAAQGDAAVIQLATLATSLERQVSDPRVSAIASVCRKQLEKGNTIDTLLQLFSMQSASPTQEDRRALEREKFQNQFQETLRQRMAAQKEKTQSIQQLQTRLVDMLSDQMVEQLEQKLKDKKNDGRAASRTSENNEGVDSKFGTVNRNTDSTAPTGTPVPTNPVANTHAGR